MKIIYTKSKNHFKFRFYPKKDFILKIPSIYSNNIDKINRIVNLTKYCENILKDYHKPLRCDISDKIISANPKLILFFQNYNNFIQFLIKEGSDKNYYLCFRRFFKTKTD